MDAVRDEGDVGGGGHWEGRWVRSAGVAAPGTAGLAQGPEVWRPGPVMAGAGR